MKYLRRNNLKAFSLLEVIITIVVLGLLASIAFVGYGTVVTRAATSSTEASLRHIDRAVSVTHAMRTAAEPGTRADEDFTTAAYGTDGTGDSDISSSTGTWDLVKADSSHASFDESTVYYVLSGGVTGMVKTVIDSSPDGNRYHLSFLKSSFAQTVTWSAWCEITPADLLDMDPGSGNWPHPDCKFEGSFQNNPGNTSPAEITDAGTVSPTQSGAYVSPIAYTGSADYVVYTFTPYSDDRPSATPAAEVVVSPNYPMPSSGETVSGLIPGVNYTVEAALYFNDPLYGPGLEDAAQLVDESDAPQTVRPYTVPATPSVTAELTESQLDGDGNVTPDFDATVTVSWGDIYTSSDADTGFASTNDMTFRVEQQRNGTWSTVTTTDAADGQPQIALNNGIYSVAVDAVAGTTMVFRVVAINAHALEAQSDPVAVVVLNIPSVPTPNAPTVGPNTLGQNAAYGYNFAWAADSNSTSVEYSLNSGAWLPLSGTEGNITGYSSPFETVTVEVRAKVYSSNDYGWVESDWASATSDFTFEGPADNGSTATAPTITTGGTVYNYTYAFDFDWNNVGADEQQCSYNGGTFTTCLGTTWTGTGSAGSTHTLQVQVRNNGTPHPIYGGGEESEWVKSNIATVNFGSPVPTPPMPAAITITPHEAADSSPQYRFTWNATSPTQLQYRTAVCTGNTTNCSFGSYTDLSPASSTAYGWYNATFNRTYRFDLRSRNCATGNAYNTSTSVCSLWREVTEKAEYVGSPLDTPPLPGTVSLSGSTRLNGTTPQVRFEWTDRNPTNQQVSRSWDGQSGWVTISNSSTSDGYFNVSSGTTYTMKARNQNCITGNVYNDGATLCSDWRESNTVSLVGPDLPHATVASIEKWAGWKTIGTNTTRYHYYVRATFNRNGFTGTVVVEFFNRANCSTDNWGSKLTYNITNPTSHKQFDSPSPSGMAKNTLSVRVTSTHSNGASYNHCANY